MLTAINTEFDLGKVKKGTRPTHTIKLLNPTNQEVVVNPIGTSCSCTTGVCSPNPIPANGFGEVEITFDTTKVETGDMIKSGVISWNIGGKYFSSNFKFKVNVS